MLRHTAEETGTQKDMGVRVFNGLFRYLSQPHEDWGMDIPWPEWIEQVHNTASGRCFMLGTGPSLTKEERLFPLLGREVTWTVNRMRKYYGTLGFAPTNHVIAEPGPVMGFGHRIGEVYDFPEAQNRIAIHWNVVATPGWLWCPKAPDDIQVRFQGIQGLGERLAPLPTAWASPFTSVQLALWMGYDEIYMLGLDTTNQGQAWDVEYGRTKQPRNIRSIMECVERVRRDIERAGRQIYDCSSGGRLNEEGILEYRKLEEVLR